METVWCEVKNTVLGCHPKCYSRRALEHYAVNVGLRWVQGVFPDG